MVLRRTVSSVCTKLEPAGSKSNEILEINVLQKFNLRVLSLRDFITPSIFNRFLQMSCQILS